MSERIVEGLWNCKYCGADAIGGLQKYCPNCGHPQDKDTKFYLGEKKRYLNEDEIKKVGTDPDWACDYCTTLNNAQFKYCKNCGAAKEKETKDYFDLRDVEKQKEKCTENYSTSNAYESEDAELYEYKYNEDKSSFVTKPIDEFPHILEEPKRSTSKNHNPKIRERGVKIGSVLGVAAFAVLIMAMILIWAFTPRQYEGIVSEKSWERGVSIEEYKTVTESAWDSVPSGGRLLYTDDEIRSYDKVFSHYETKSRQVAEQVFDGYDEHVSYSDNGNGTFTEHVTQTPKYRTEYKTEYYEEAVYKDVPVYDTKYYYEIERWIYDRTEDSDGVNNIPYWPDYKLDSNERVFDKEESYQFDIYVESKDKTYTYYCENQFEWEQYILNQDVDITVSAGMVIEIK